DRLERPALRLLERPIVEIWRVPGGADGAVPGQLHELKLLRHRPPVAFPIGMAVLDLVFQVEEGPRLLAGVRGIDEYGPLAEQVAVPLQDEVARRVKEGMARTDELRQGLPLHTDLVLVERDALV